VRPAFRGGVRVATGDTNGDGVDEIIASTGKGGQPSVGVFDNTGFLLTQRVVFNEAFRGGVYVAAGDVNGDGFDDIIVGAGAVAPRVKAVSGLDGSELTDFAAFRADFRGGVRVAAVDRNGDGSAEIVAAAGRGQGPIVNVFDFVLGEIVRSFFTDGARDHGSFVAGSRS
jgi:hypothetical protein